MARKLGCGPLAAFLLILVILIMVAANEAVGYYFTHCDTEDLLDCMLTAMEGEEEQKPEEGTVTATGVYTYKGHSVTVTMNIPLKGGEVTGTVSGTCEGKFKGDYSGSALGGSMSGVCSPFIINVPASASFTGSVNKSAKTVPVNFDGSGGGITHYGEMTLTYP